MRLRSGLTNENRLTQSYSCWYSLRRVPTGTAYCSCMLQYFELMETFLC